MFSSGLESCGVFLQEGLKGPERWKRAPPGVLTGVQRVGAEAFEGVLLLADPAVVALLGLLEHPLMSLVCRVEECSRAP